MTKWHYLIIIVLLAILAFLVWKSPVQLLTDDSLQDQQKGKSYPSSYLTNTNTTQYNEQGHVSHVLTAKRIRYYQTNHGSSEDIALFDQPAFLFHTQVINEAPWKTVSDQGRSDHNGDEFLLTGNVILSQKNSDSSFTTITSEQLLIRPNEQYAETDKPVMIKSEAGTTTAVGLKISLTHGTVEFLSKVRSQYDLR